MLPPRRYERLARLLLQLVQETLEPDVAAATATALGRAFGQQTAEEFAGDGVQAPVKLSPSAVMDWMEIAGYGAKLALQRQRRDGHRGPQLRLPGAFQGVPRGGVRLRPQHAVRHARRRVVSTHPDARAELRRFVLPARVQALAPLLRRRPPAAAP